MVEVSKFMSKVDTSGDCWVWVGAKNGNGYGRGYNPTIQRTRYAHRLSYEIFYGYEPTEVMHSCDNRACVKPTHLSDGTRELNMRDMAAKARGNTVKLTVSQVQEIREGGNTADMVKRYGVSKATINQVKRRQTWKDVK